MGLLTAIARETLSTHGDPCSCLATQTPGPHAADFLGRALVTVMVRVDRLDRYAKRAGSGAPARSAYRRSSIPLQIMEMPGGTGTRRVTSIRMWSRLVNHLGPSRKEQFQF